MQGETGVISREDEGSTFWFTARFGSSAISSEDTSFDASVLAERRVLVVDDNATNRKVLDRQLSHLGMRPVCVDGAQAALQTLESAPPGEFHLAVLDYMMPGCDGFELGRQIAGVPDSATPVWYCSPPPTACAARKSSRSSDSRAATD